MQILAICGSVRPQSSNLSILQKLGSMLPGNVDYTIYRGIDTLPHFNPDLDNDNPGETFNHFRSLVQQADAVIICTPEYAFGVPGVLKNALDWTVFSGSFNTKPTAVITASSVGNNAHASLLLTFKALGAVIPPHGEILIPFVRTKVSEQGAITDMPILEAFEKLLAGLMKAAEKNVDATQ